MRSAILGKLQPYLNEYPKSEADVVYVLVEIRKLMDQAAGGAYMPPFGMCAINERPTGAGPSPAGDGQTRVLLNGAGD